MIGGVIGLKLVGSLFGAAVGAAILQRMLMAVTMIMGILISAMVCVLGCGMIGWSTGLVIETLTSGERATVDSHQKAK